VAIGDYEFASRLSYFLWSSMPDEELFTLAANRTLRDPAVLESQVSRMLKSPKSQALVDQFASQWLQIHNLRNAARDPAGFPGFDPELRDAMARETLLCFGYVVAQNRSILELLDADYTFLNERLAKHYGISNVAGNQFRKVPLAGNRNRGGLVTQASILTVTSNPTRTSPVKRGKWILEQILGTPPPPPPPDIPALPDDKKTPLTGTLRQRMEQHRANPSCASCHARLDPLGFGLENFDAIGAWRDRDGDAPIDATGVLPTGESFNGPAELKTVLKSKSDAFVRNLVEKMTTFATGRGIEPADVCAIDTIVADLAQNQHKFHRLILDIVRSDPFQKRRSLGAAP
jgi:hypothetical protein